MTPRPAPVERSVESFLDLLAAPVSQPTDCSHVMAVFAHPDDETLAVGGQLARLRGMKFVHVTDGAPVKMDDAFANGFSQREEYAAARRQEIVAALGEAGVRPEAVLTLGAIDQQAAFDMARLAAELAELFRAHGTTVVITHAYEGGHPDHDATAFIAHGAAQVMANEAQPAPEIIECPLYHSRNGRRMFQEFAPVAGDPPEIALELDDEAAGMKRRMLAAHVTQQRLLAGIAIKPERFRVAPHYDFAKLPNDGELLYEAFDWGLDGQTWLRLAAEARRELGLPQWL